MCYNLGTLTRGCAFGLLIKGWAPISSCPATLKVLEGEPECKKPRLVNGAKPGNQKLQSISTFLPDRWARPFKRGVPNPLFFLELFLNPKSIPWVQTPMCSQSTVCTLTYITVREFRDVLAWALISALFTSWRILCPKL